MNSPENEGETFEPGEAVSAALAHLQNLGKHLEPILAGLENHQDTGRQLHTLLNAHFRAVEGEIHALRKCAAVNEFPEEEVEGGEFVWDGPAEAVAAALGHLQDLGTTLNPMLSELETRQNLDRRHGQRMTVLLRAIERELKAVLRHLKEHADA